MNDDLYFDLLQAEKEGLIEIEFSDSAFSASFLEVLLKIIDPMPT